MSDPFQIEKLSIVNEMIARFDQALDPKEIKEGISVEDVDHLVFLYAGQAETIIRDAGRLHTDTVLKIMALILQDFFHHPYDTDDFEAWVYDTLELCANERPIRDRLFILDHNRLIDTYQAKDIIYRILDKIRVIHKHLQAYNKIHLEALEQVIDSNHVPLWLGKLGGYYIFEPFHPLDYE